MHVQPLSDGVERFLRTHAVSGPILAAVSGGPDSVALALALAELCPAASLVIGHLHHGLRGKESDEDAASVAALGERLRIPVEVGRIAVKEIVQASGENLESAARRVRYQWLADLASARGIAWIATAHTADDQAETVLHHVLRGTGLRGLRGIAGRLSVRPGIDVIRPLLGVRRAEVGKFLAERGVQARLDSTNLDTARTRNWIRQTLLPTLAAEFNPGVVENLCRLAEHARAAMEVIEQSARELLGQAERPKAGKMVVLDANVLLRGRHGRDSRATRHLAREVLWLIWEREGWPLGEMDFGDWDRLADLVFDKATAIDLPGGISARRKAGVLQLYRQ